MRGKAALIIVLLGIAVGFITGILDSVIQYTNLQEYKILNIIVFVVFFAAMSYALIIYRNQINGGFMSYWSSLFSSMILGLVSSFTISLTRFVYLKYISKTDIDIVLDKTEKIMLDHYNQYGDELIDNRLSFIEFSYEPVVSSMLYFIYFMIFVIAFSIIGSFFIRRIDRNIAI